MGSGASAEAAAADFEGRTEFGMWTIEGLNGALERWEKVRGGEHEVFMTKRAWYEVFNDYSRIVDGAFVTLPLSLFNKFDAGGQGKVFAYEVFAVMGLFADAYMDSKLEWLFHLFDWDGNESISMPEMVILLQSITGGMYRLGITKRQPQGDVLEKLANNCFGVADVDDDGRVTLDEFLRWGSEEVAAKSMLVKFGGGKGNKPKKRRSVATDKGKSAVAAGGAGGSKTILGDAKDDVVDMNSVRIHDKHVRQRKYRLIANSKLMHDLKRHTKFDMPQLQALAREFVDESDSAGNLSKRKFQKVLAKRLPRLADDTILDQLFSVIDTNHDGNIQFKEFTSGLSQMCHGTLDQKMGLVFSIHDTDGDGTISIAELLELILKGHDTLRASVDRLQEIMDSFDDSHDGRIDKSEFMAALHKDNMLLAAFTTVAAVTPDKRKILLEMREHLKGFQHSSLVAALGHMKRDVEQRRLVPMPVTLEGLNAWFASHFGITEEEDQELIADLYAAYDAKKDGNVKFRDILSGCIQILAPSQETEADELFDLYDADGDGVIDSNEVSAMLLQRSASMDTDATEVVDALRKMDVDGNERISKREWMDMARKQPAVMATLEWMFNVVPARAAAGSPSAAKKSGKAKRGAGGAGGGPTRAPSGRW